jgi:hypothetical protein
MGLDGAHDIAGTKTLVEKYGKSFRKRMFQRRLKSLASGQPSNKQKTKGNLELVNTFSICSQEEEDSYRATVKCTKSRALRSEMRKYWRLPPKRNSSYSGLEWLQNLLRNADKSKGAIS